MSTTVAAPSDATLGSPPAVLPASIQPDEEVNASPTVPADTTEPAAPESEKEVVDKLATDDNHSDKPLPAAPSDVDGEGNTIDTPPISHNHDNPLDKAETMSESLSTSEWEKVEKPTSPPKSINPASNAVKGKGTPNGTGKLALDSPFRRRDSDRQTGGRERDDGALGRKVGEVKRVLKEGVFGGELIVCQGTWTQQSCGGVAATLLLFIVS